MLKSINQFLSKLLNEKHLGELLRGGATTFILRFIGYGIGLLLIVFISRVYGAKVLGEYSLAITVLTLSSLFVRLGFESSIVKLFSERIKYDDWAGIKIIYNKVFQIIIFSGLIISSLLFFNAELLAIKLFSKPQLVTHIKIVSLLVIPLSLRLVNADCYRGFKNMRGFAYSKHISYFLYALVILIGLTIWSKDDLNPIIAYAAGLLILSFSSTAVLYQKISSNVSKSALEIPTHKSLLELSIPMLLTTASIILSGQVIKLLLGIYETEEQLGIFNATLSAVMIQGFIQNATNSIVGPKFAEIRGQNNAIELQKISHFTSTINVYLTLPLTIILILFNKPILNILGSDFVQGSSSFIIMLVGNAIAVLCGPVGVLMNMTGMQKTLRNIISASLLVSILSAVYLIPEYGIIGGAISYSIFIVLWNVTCSAYVKSKTGINTFFWPTLKSK